MGLPSSHPEPKPLCAMIPHHSPLLPTGLLFRGTGSEMEIHVQETSWEAFCGRGGEQDRAGRRGATRQP